MPFHHPLFRVNLEFPDLVPLSSASIYQCFSPNYNVNLLNIYIYSIPGFDIQYETNTIEPTTIFARWTIGVSYFTILKTNYEDTKYYVMKQYIAVGFLRGREASSVGRAVRPATERSRVRVWLSACTSKALWQSLNPYIAMVHPATNGDLDPC